MKRDLVVALGVTVTFHALFLLAFNGKPPPPPPPPPDKIDITDFQVPPDQPPPPPDQPQPQNQAQDTAKQILAASLPEPPAEVAVDSVSELVHPSPPVPPMPNALRTIGIPMSTNRGPVGRGGAKIFDISQLDRRPEGLFQQKPNYPISMKQQGIQGTVVVEAIIDSHGNVDNPVIYSSPNPDFNDPALQAVSKWKFRPGRKDGRAVNTRVRIPIVFSLTNNSD